MGKKSRSKKMGSIDPVQPVFVAEMDLQYLLAVARKVEQAVCLDSGNLNKANTAGIRKLIKGLEAASKSSSSGSLLLTEVDVDFLSSNLELAASHLLHQPNISEEEKRAIRNELGPVYQRLLVAKCAFELLYPHKSRESIPLEERQSLFWHLNV